MNDSLDNPEDSSFLQSLTNRWNAWREHRRFLAEERRELRKLEASEKNARQAMDPNFSDDLHLPRRGFKNAELFSDDVKVLSGQRNLADENDLQVEELNRQDSLFAKLREAARIRREIREEARAIEKDQRTNFANARPLPSSSEDDLSVGHTVQSTEGQDDNLKFSFSRFIRELWFELNSLRVPQWLVATLPTVGFIVSSVIPHLTQTSGNNALNKEEYSVKWSALVDTGDWKAAELCGSRLLRTGTFDIDDDFRYFDCLMKTGDQNRAVRFLIFRESQVRSSDLATYRFRLSKQLSSLPNIARLPGLRSLAYTKLQESISGPLSEENEEKARQILANVAITQGNFLAATGYLEPIANRSPFIAADLLFLKFNQASDRDLGQLRSAASELLVNIETSRGDVAVGDLSLVRARLRLMIILDREKEARAWLVSLNDLSERDRKAIGLELEKLSLLTEGRKRPVKSEILWPRIQPLLESEPNNQAFLRLALGIWAQDDRQPGNPLDVWVRRQFQSDTADIEFFRQGCLATHKAGLWAEARSFYRKVLEREPNDITALNNLSGLMYKFPPVDLNESLRLVDRALELAPESLVILETKGQVLARMGRFEEAREILVKTIPALPKEWNLHNTLAQIYSKLGDTKNAEAHLNTLKSIPKPTDADQYAVITD